VSCVSTVRGAHGTHWMVRISKYDDQGRRQAGFLSTEARRATCNSDFMLSSDLRGRFMPPGYLRRRFMASSHWRVRFMPPGLLRGRFMPSSDPAP